MHIVLPTIDWRELAEVVSSAHGPVAWCWYALRDQQGAWQLAGLTVRGQQPTRTETLSFGHLLVRTEQLSPRQAAENLAGETSGKTREFPSGLPLAPDGTVHPRWVTTEPDSQHLWVSTEWPGWYAEAGLSPSQLPGFNDLHLPADAHSASQPYYPSGFAAVASRVYGTPPGWAARYPQRHVVVWLPQKSIRLHDVRFRSGTVSVEYQRGSKSRRRLVAKAAWRLAPEDAEYRHDATEPREDDGVITFDTGALPVEFSVQISDRKRLLDRREWSERTGAAPVDDSNLQAQLSVWLLQGEGIQLEYKEALGRTHNLEFAETVASFANGLGGIILLGVTNKGEVRGFDPDGVADTVTNIVRSHVSEYLEVQMPPPIRIDGKPVYVVRVPPGDSRPYQAGGKIYVRAGATDRVATPAEVRALSVGHTADIPFGRY